MEGVSGCYKARSKPLASGCWCVVRIESRFSRLEFLMFIAHPPFLVPLDRRLFCKPRDLGGLNGATHFGVRAGWVYGAGKDVCGWVEGQPRPCFGLLGCVMVAEA